MYDPHLFVCVRFQTAKTNQLLRDRNVKRNWTERCTHTDNPIHFLLFYNKTLHPYSPLCYSQEVLNRQHIKIVCKNILIEYIHII